MVCPSAHSPSSRACRQHLLCLTSERRGDTGKGILCGLLKAALGEQYARTVEVGGMQRTQLAAFEGVRLIVVEEGAVESIDSALLEELNGGDARVSIRVPHGPETPWAERQMHWTAKMILQEPTRCRSAALLAPHRALLCRSDEEWTAHSGEAHSYRADETAEARARLPPQAFLAWFLQGLGVYHVEHFTCVQ